MNYNIIVSGGTASISLSKMTGVSESSINSLINSIQYQNTNPDNPTAGNRVFTLTQIQDSGGTSSGGQDTTTLNIQSTAQVVPVNDPAILSSDEVDLFEVSIDYHLYSRHFTSCRSMRLLLLHQCLDE